MRIKNFDLYSLILGLSSFVVLILGLFHFDNTVAQKRALTLQISQYEIGAQVEYMRATVSGRTEAGMLIFQDFVGTKIVTDLKDDSLHLGNLVALKGKIALSLLAIIVLLWKLLGRVKVSSQGLILSP